MARQYQLPGTGFINADEDGREYQVPGGGYFNDDTAAAPGGGSLLPTMIQQGLYAGYGNSV